MTLIRTILAILAVGALAAAVENDPVLGPVPGDAPGAHGGQAGPGGPGPGPGGPGGAGGQQRRVLEELIKLAESKGDLTLEDVNTVADKVRIAEKEKQFAAMDTNKDGQISKEEFMAYDPAAQAGPPGQNAPPGQPGQTGPSGQRRGPDLADLFKRIDTNGDGKLSKEELQAAREKLAQMQQQRRGGGGPGGPPGGKPKGDAPPVNPPGPSGPPAP